MQQTNCTDREREARQTSQQEYMLQLNHTEGHDNNSVTILDVTVPQRFSKEYNLLTVIFLCCFKL